VTFDIDANGILNVTAKDKATNNEQKITISSSSGLSKEEVDKMAKDAEAHSADDRKHKDEIDARNRADSMVYQVEKMLKEHRDKIGEADAKAVEESLEATRKVMSGGTVEEINKAVDALTQASHKLAEAMYKSAGTPPGTQGPGASGQPGTDGATADGAAKPKDNVVDAEFVDVEEKKK
jgi:molecular chaperone DnaK